MAEGRWGVGGGGHRGGGDDGSETPEMAQKQLCDRFRGSEVLAVVF